VAVVSTLKLMSVLDIRKPGRRQPVSLDTLGSSLGLKVSRTDQLIDQVQHGLSFKALVSLEAISGMTASEIASMIGIPARTLARRRVAGKLAPDESERLLRIATVFEKAVGLFEGDVPAALAWLRAPKKALSQQSPWTFARSELGAREVLDLIGRLEYGVFT
jgi:putative toxin-antitoxin system antitoxin component (TIGR02293 family)